MNIALIVILLLLLGGGISPKRKLTVKYVCHRGCNWKIFGKCMSRDYDWKVQVLYPFYNNETKEIEQLQMYESAAWDYDNPESFYAEIAAKGIEQAATVAESRAHQFGNLDFVPLNQTEIETIYSKDFAECAEKDAILDMFTGNLPALIRKYLFGA